MDKLLRIGKFILHRGYNNKTKIYIGLDSGEGGEFNEIELEKAIDNFYQKYF